MSFKGDFYGILNYGSNKEVSREFDAILKRYGLYYELGDAWNLTVSPI